MTRDDSYRINDLFAAGTHDLTPICARHTAYILYVPVSHDPEVSKFCASVLSDIELQRAHRFANENDKALFKQRRAFRRYCGATASGSSRPLSEIVFEETEKGQPYLSELANIHFSFSSCRSGFLGAWSWTHGIGVDIEDQTRNLEAVELARCFFTGAEANAVEELDGLHRRQVFFQFWSLKEAALKSIGEGLPLGLNSFKFELEPNLRLVHAPPGYGGPEQYNPHIIEGTGNCAAIVIRKLT